MKMISRSHQFNEFEEPGEETGEFTLSPNLSGEFFSRLVPFGVIVEMWDKRKEGRIGRAYRAEFTESEQRLLATWYAKLYRWHLVSGTPRRVSLRPKTLELLRRAAHFFATA